MKKITKMTALLLTASIALTSCSAPFDLGSDKKDEKTQQQDNSKDEAKTEKQDSDPGILDSIFGIFGSNDDKKENISDNGETDIYVNSEITSVTDEPYTMNGRSGKYTGDWKGDRPEGEGKLVIDDNQYCCGAWINGMLDGNGESVTYKDNGMIYKYSGFFTANEPSGEGVLRIEEPGSDYYTLICGDFSSSEMQYGIYTKQNDYLSDAGKCINGQMISFVENPEMEGIDYSDPTLAVYDKYDERSKYDHYEGKYYGDVDENGLPNGYGYFKGDCHYTTVYAATYDETYWDTNNWLQFSEDEWNELSDAEKDKFAFWMRTGYDYDTAIDPVHINYLGKWEHGKRIGEYRICYWNDTKPDWGIDEYAFIDANGNYEGEATSITFGEPFKMRTIEYEDAVMWVTRQNNDTFYDCKLCDDGSYRGSDQKTEVYFTNGNYGLFVHRILKASPDSSKETTEGEWYIYNSDNKLLECGIYVPGSGWVSYEYLEKLEQDKNRQRLENWEALGLAVGVGLALYGLAKWEEKSDAEFFQKVKERSAAAQRETQQYLENKERKQDLLDEARSQYEIGNTYEAQRLYNEAQEINIGSLW